MKCLKCGYERQPADTAPGSECPRCGAIYAKVQARRERREREEVAACLSAQPPARKDRAPQPDMEGIIREIALLVRAHYGLIHIKTVEEERSEALLEHLADQLGLPFFIWTVNHGLRRADSEKSVYGTLDAKGALDHIISAQYQAVYLMHGLGPFLSDAALCARITDAGRTFATTSGAIIMTGHDLNLPETAKHYLAEVTPPAPRWEDYEELLKNIIRDTGARQSIKIEMTKADINRLLNNLKGLTLLEAEKILTKAVIEDGRLTPKDIEVVIKAKQKVLERDGLLEYFPAEQSMSDIADMRSLKAWLAQRANIISDPEHARSFGLTFPKGILLLGVPGSGKSLCAKAVSMEWGLPLLKMDPSNLYNKYIGESERNFKRAMDTAEKMSPVILWIDEIEKAFAAGGSEDGGVSQRILGSFLSWMQDRTGDVFVVATANDVAKLPPEFLRKGRFDEIFFVDLPDAESRAAIFGIHLKRRGRDQRQFDVERLAQATDGFSGSEIEQVIVSGLYSAFASQSTLTTALLLKEIEQTRPLSKTRAEHITALRAWAKTRTVSAH